MLNQDQISEAIEQMKVQCELKMAGYEMCSARQLLRELGYHGEDADTVILAIAKRGFDYCLDPQVPHDGQRPTSSVCVWGPDQLLSRLQCL